MASSDYYMLKLTREASKVARSHLKWFKKQLLPVEKIGERMKLKAEIRNMRQYLSELPDSSFYRKKAKDLGRRDELLETMIDLQQRKDRWSIENIELAKRMLEETMNFIKNCSIEYTELTRLHSVMKRL